MEFLQDHDVKVGVDERMTKIMESQDSVSVNGNSKKWFTDQHLKKLNDLSPFQDEVKDGMLRDILRRQDSQSSIAGVFSNLIKIFFPESTLATIPDRREFISNLVIHELMLFVYQKSLNS